MTDRGGEVPEYHQGHKTHSFVPMGSKNGYFTTPGNAWRSPKNGPPRRLKPCPVGIPATHWQVCIVMRDGTKKRLQVSAACLAAETGQWPPPGMVASHRSGVKPSPQEGSEAITWQTESEDKLQRSRDGHHPHGKWTPNEVVALAKRDREYYGVRLQAIASYYGVQYKTMLNILKGVRRKGIAAAPRLPPGELPPSATFSPPVSPRPPLPLDGRQRGAASPGQLQQPGDGDAQTFLPA